ncbi:zincin-like metallopeptidase domain-containing protein [Bradyrhizobium sp. UFLA05-109]
MFEYRRLHVLLKREGYQHSRSGPRENRRLVVRRYAMEELAELGAAVLCAELGIAVQPRADHAQYLAHWLNALKADKRAIFTAAPKAGEAVASCTTTDKRETEQLFFHNLVLLSQSVAAFTEKNHIFEKTHLFSMRRG